MAPKKHIEVFHCPKWTPIYDAESREDVEDRVMVRHMLVSLFLFMNLFPPIAQCREFIKRFQAILRIPKTHVDSLDAFDTFSEQTCKALLIGLLDVIGADESDESAKRVSSLQTRSKAA